MTEPPSSGGGGTPPPGPPPATTPPRRAAAPAAPQAAPPPAATGPTATPPTAAPQTATEPAAPPNVAGRDVDQGTWLESGFEWGLVLARGLVLLPVVVLVFAAAAAFVYGSALFVWLVIDVFPHPFPVGNRIGIFLVVVDLFLVGATLLIAAMGFYELFFTGARRGGRRAHLPGWLVMNDLNDLKARVISMLVLVAAVTFVDIVVDFHGGRDILYIGIAVAVVIAALTAFLRYGTSREDS